MGLPRVFAARTAFLPTTGLFVCPSGEFMLLSVIDGQETVLRNGPAARAAQAQPTHPHRRSHGRGAARRLHQRRAAGVRAATTPSPVAAMRVVAGPGVAARLDDFSLRGPPTPGIRPR